MLELEEIVEDCGYCVVWLCFCDGVHTKVLATEELQEFCSDEIDHRFEVIYKESIVGFSRARGMRRRKEVE